MGRHTKPTETVTDGGQAFNVFWDDLTDDGSLEKATLTKLQHFSISVAHGVIVAVALVVAPDVWAFLTTGEIDVPSLVDTVKVTAISALVSHFRPRR